MNKAVVIFSGGQDSTTCLLWALQMYDEVYAITFNYGQNHSAELACATEICKRLNVKQCQVGLSFFADLVESALTSGGDVNEMKNGLPASFVPNRNQLFITLAHAYAQKIGAKTLVIGACETDYSGYPDCRKEFINKIQEATNLGSNADVEIETPLMYMTKAETFDLANRMGGLELIIEQTNTCYKGNREILHDWGYGCGECPACKLREKGFKEWKENYPQ